MYTIKYFDDNVYTGDISDTSDIKYVKVFNFDYNFSTEKSIVSDYITSTACVCFYKNKGTSIFPTGRYKEQVITFSNESFYQDSDLDHNLNNALGYRSSSIFFGSSEASFYFSNDCGIKINFNDVYGVSFSFWIYVDGNILYVKDKDGLLYTHILGDSSFSFGFYNGTLVVNSEDIITIVGKFLPYDLFLYGDFTDINIISKYSIPMVLEGTGDVKDGIYGDAYYIVRPATGLGYLKSKANNVLTSCSGFVFDIAFRAVGNSIPFSLSDGATFSGSNFVMNNANVWVEFDIVSNVFYSNIVTSSGIVTISGVASECNDYYLMRCYYEGNRFGVILNGVDTNTVCDGVTISGGYLNLLAYNTLIVDSFALYKDISPPIESYNQSLAKLTSSVSNTALVNSHDINKVLFGIDNFFPEDYYYSGTWSGIENVPITSSPFNYYAGYFLAGGEAELSNDYFYASRLPFNEDVYNCFICENDKTFLTYFSGISVPINTIVAESFTNYDYVNDNFITTNSGLYIRNYSKVFNSINSASVIEFSNIEWVNPLSLGVLFEADSIPELPNLNCTAVTGSGILHVGNTTFSGLDINSNNSIYFYLNGSSVLVSGSNVGVLGSGIVANDYSYIKYFIKNDSESWAFVDKVYVSTAQVKVATLTNKCFDYSLPDSYNLNDNYKEVFYSIGSNILGSEIVLYDYDFYDLECSFSSYYDVTFSGTFNVGGYSFLGISDTFENGFIIERWRQVCSPYGVYLCNQPGWISISAASCNCVTTRLYDGNLSTSVHSSMYIISIGDYYYLYFTNTDVLIDTISIYVTSDYINPGDGFVISCDIEYYEDGVGWHSLLNNYASPTLSGISWPIRHDIEVPLTRCDDIRIKANSNWDQVVPTEIRPSCFYNYGGTAVCTTNEVTCVHVVLDDDLCIYSEYVLEDLFDLSFSGINCYPLNFELCLKDYSGNECYIKTDWITSSGCNVIVSSVSGDITSTVYGIYGSVEYVFSASRFLDKIDLIGYINSGSGTSVYSNYSFSADDLGVGLTFYNESLPNAVGSGCLFGFEAENYTVNFSSIAAGYKYTSLDGTGNITKAGIGFNTGPPNLFVDKIKGSYVGQSHKSCQELTSSGLHLVSNNVDNNVSIKVGGEEVGGIQQVSKFNRISLFSDYKFMPTIFYRTYFVGENQQYASFSEVSSLVQDGDKVYFYPGSYTITTDKQIYIIGVGHSTDIHVSINNASGGITVINCTTTKCKGSGVFNMYNCYMLSWNYNESLVVLYDVVNMNCYNCDLYNYSYTSYSTSYFLLHKCAVYRTQFYRVVGLSITVYDEGYDTRGHYGYGPEFNKARVISGLSHIESIKVLSFYYNSIYNHFPLHSQSAIESDSCNQLITGEDTYSVYFYGDLKKLNSFSMYLFIQDLDGVIEIKNSSDFVFTVDSNNLNCGMSLVIKIYGLEISMPVPISHSNVFKLAVVAVVFDGGSISIYLNGAKLATKYIIVVDFNDPSSYLNDSILFFDDNKFTCDGNGLLLKGAALYESIDFLLGTHIEEEGSNSSVQTRVNMEFSTFPVIAEYHGIINYYGYSAYNTGVGVYFDVGSYEYKRIYFKANKSCKTSNNMTIKYVGSYKVKDIYGNCVDESTTTYISPQKNDSVTFSAAKIDSYTFGYCDIIDPYGYASLYLSLPLPAIERSTYCFDVPSSVILLSFDLSSDPYFQDVGPNNLTCLWENMSYGSISSEEGIFHKCAECKGGDYFYIGHNNVLNLNTNFTIEFLLTHFDDNGFSGTLLTKGTTTYNIAYRVGINSRHIPYFTWSWEGDNTVYANKQIRTGDINYLCIVIGTNTISFYINGENVGIKYTDKLTIVNNSEQLRIVSGYYAGSSYKKQVSIEELCIIDAVKTENEIINTWNKIGGGDNAPWIKINNVVVSSNKPIKISPSDRFIELDGRIDISKWEYRSYIKPQTDEGLVLDSRLTKKIKSKSISYNVIFDVSVFCEFLEYSTNRSWSARFKYKFISGNYITVVVNYVKYDGLYVYCEYYYNGYKSNTSSMSLALSPCGIRFITDYSGYTYVQIGDRNFWYTIWTSTQDLFVETSGWLEVALSNDDWDSWFVVKLTNFLSRQYCDTISNGDTLNFYDAVPYGRVFYSQMPRDVANLTLNNAVFEIDFSSAGSGCVHSLEFVNGDLSDSHVLDLNNNIFDNVNYEIFNIELLVYLTYSDTKILDLFPWITIEVKNKYLYIVMNDNDHTITDSISQPFNDYVYIAISIGNPHTTVHVNDQIFIYDTNFTKLLPYHFYPIGKSFSGRVVYFCGYYGSFDEVGYGFRVSSLSRYIGFDNCGRKVFGNNMVTSLDQCSIIYSYDNPVYSICLKSLSYTLSYNENVDVKILIDPAVLQSIVASVVIIRCEYSGLEGKKTTSITVSATEHTVSHNYYDSFGGIGEDTSIFSYDLVGICYDNDSVFYLSIDNNLLEKILTGVLVLNIKNNETKTITSINVYLNGELSINDIYKSSLLV